MRGRLVAGTAALSIALAGCSGSGSGHAHATTPPTTAQLSAAMIKASDLPGYASQAADKGDSDTQLQEQVARCIGITIAPANQLREVDSPTFAKAATSISSSANAYRTAAELDARERVLLSPKADACFGPALRQVMSGVLPSTIKLDKTAFHIAAGSGGGPSNVIATAHGQVTVSQGGESQTSFVDIVFVKGRLTGVTIDFTGNGAPVSADVEKKIVATVSARVAKL